MTRVDVTRGSLLVPVVCALLVGLSALGGCAQPSAPASTAKPEPPKAEPTKAQAAPAEPTKAQVAPAAPTQPAAAAQTAPSKQRYKIRYALIPSAAVPLFEIGRDKKIHEDLGLDVEFLRFNSGPAQFAAMRSKDIEVGDLSAMAALIGLSQGLDAKIFSLDYDISPTNVLVVQPDSGIKGAKDLKGKRISAPAGSSSYHGLVTYLSAAGMSIGDVQFLSMDASAITPAFIKKDLDAAWHWAPWYNRMMQSGGVRITDNSQVGALGWGVVLARADWLKQNPEAARLLIEAQYRILKVKDAEKDKFISILGSTLGSTPEEATQIFGVTPYINPEDMARKDSKYTIVSGYDDGSAGLGALLKQSAEFAFKEKMISQPVDTKAAIDPGPMQAWAASKR